jgi:hypothetical protein
MLTTWPSDLVKAFLSARARPWVTGVAFGSGRA